MNFTRLISTILFVIYLLINGINFAHAYDIRGLPSITILAPSSLTKPLSEIIRLYSKEHNITVTATFDNSSELTNKITEGEAANVFISSNDIWLNQLKQLGVLNVNSVTTLMRNKLVLVTSDEHPIAILHPEKVDFDEVIGNIISQKIPITLFVIGDPENVPLGHYTQQSLTNLGYWTALKPVILPVSSSSKALYMIAKGQNIGITYLSDTINNPEVRVIADIDPALHDPIIYWAAVVIDDQMDNAINFLNFMKSKQAASILQKHGFHIN